MKLQLVCPPIHFLTPIVVSWDIGAQYVRYDRTKAHFVGALNELHQAVSELGHEKYSNPSAIGYIAR